MAELSNVPEGDKGFMAISATWSSLKHRVTTLFDRKGNNEVRGLPDATVEIARAHYLASPHTNGSLPNLGTRWGQIRREMEDAICGFQSAADAIRFAQLRSVFDHRTPVTQTDIPQMKTAQHLLRYEYPQFRDKILLLSETPATTPGTAIEFQTIDGGRVFASNILYFHAFYLLSVLKFKKDVDSVCEIGGGYGNPALLWLTNPIQRVSRYVIVDMPESLFFAEVFLRTAVPDIAVHYATEYVPASAAPGVTLVPIQLAHQTNTILFDIVVNTGSMAEMTDDWVGYWRDWLDQQNTNLFYSHNYFGNPIERLFEGRSTLAPTVPRSWRPVDVRVMHPMMLLHSDERLAAEIIFKRMPLKAEQDVAGALEFFDGVHLSLENYAYFLYALLRDIDGNSRHLMTFARKVITDFGYAPVELLHLLSKVENGDKDLLALRDDLQRRFNANYPQGIFSS